LQPGKNKGTVASEMQAEYLPLKQRIQPKLYTPWNGASSKLDKLCEFKLGMVRFEYTNKLFAGTSLPSPLLNWQHLKSSAINKNVSDTAASDMSLVRPNTDSCINILQQDSPSPLNLNH
jgi:hypothetical protein